ncbi:prepilin-type N-terminal cleavage/methylation domain-containing protein [Neorhodopirellula lusitana]|uniref:Prepilin-type N-terminal cleavage/methylation domain-containing protein n=1 Tax=Neorhodopirellula lusitana TaxID=445327 RepID=A0ABY1QC40_9BACT|nr:type II secretion system protein [Neorhodopirellula lusitana]SMP63340.1 prepilin-type N-terminal cleavage/methylation domain-containing protein [Neorhodopirellula lusitana]
MPTAKMPTAKMPTAKMPIAKMAIATSMPVAISAAKPSATHCCVSSGVIRRATALADCQLGRFDRLRISRRASGFTIIELLLAMTIFAAAAALVLPTIGGLLTDRRLVRATDQVRAEMIRLRVYAMRNGRVMKLSTESAENLLTITPVFSAADALQANDQSGGQASLLSDADQTTGAISTNSMNAEEEGWTIELPEGVQVSSIVTSAVGGSGSIEAASLTTEATGTDTSNTTSGSVYFYPTGQTSNAILTVSDSLSPDVFVLLRGLTGSVEVKGL